MGRAHVQTTVPTALGQDLPPFALQRGGLGATAPSPRPATHATTGPGRPTGSPRAKDGDLLLRELLHRIRNSLAIIDSIASLESQGLQDPAALDCVGRLRSRVMATALLYERLGVTGQPGAVEVAPYLEELATLLAESLSPGPEAVRIDLAVDDIVLGSKEAGALGLIVNEAVTNSFKYGLGPSGGQIRIECRRLPRGRCRLLVADNGPGFPEGIGPDSGDFGFTLMGLQAEELGGSLALEPGRGAAISVTFPLRAEAR